MRRKSVLQKRTPEKLIRDIRRKTRRHWSAEEKIRIVLEGLRGEYSIAELCRREGIAESQYYAWSKEFLEAGKRRLAGDTAREATSGQVKDLRSELTALKEVVAELTLENRVLKKSMTGITASRDGADVWGCADHAIGVADGNLEPIEAAKSAIVDSWREQSDEWDQGRWAYLFDEGLIDAETANAWADEVRSQHEEEEVA